jgi:hypothetical protein
MVAVLAREFYDTSLNSIGLLFDRSLIFSSQLYYRTGLGVVVEFNIHYSKDKMKIDTHHHFIPPVYAEGKQSADMLNPSTADTLDSSACSWWGSIWLPNSALVGGFDDTNYGKRRDI